jgi:hypothetical protein
MTALALAWFLAAAPCVRVAVVPFEPLATTPAISRALEEEVRTGLSTRPGLCVEARAATIEKLSKFERHRLPPCGDLACVGAQLSALEVDEVITGVVVGTGGRRNVDLLRSTATRTARATGSELELGAAVGVLYQWDAGGRGAPRRWPSIALAAAGLASAGVGVALGVEAHRNEQVLSGAVTGCPGGGTAYRDCLDGQLRTGKTEATAANVLFGVAGALVTGAVVLWVVDLP